MSWVYLNGAFLPAEEAKIAAGDAGLQHGRGLFETFRARGGAVYRLGEHVARLSDGARVLSIALPPALEGLAGIVRELTERCDLADARVRLTLTAGAEGGEPSLLIQAQPVTGYPAQLYMEGVSAVIAATRRNETSPLARVKSLNYLDNLLSREAARSAGAHEAIFLNTRGLLADGSASNVFLVRGGELLTPPVDDGALPGITRAAALDLARAAGIPAREASLTEDDLRSAEEAFLTNAVGGVVPLVSVEGHTVGTGAPGEVTRRVAALYDAAVRCG